MDILKKERKLVQNGKLHIREVLNMLPGRTVSSLWKRARKLGIKAPLRKLSNDDSFFSIPNVLNSYWAGFIAADGCINRNNVEITLKRTDREHLQQFVTDTQFTGELKDILKQGYPSTRLTVCSRPWIVDLEKNFCITPRKSKTLLPPNIVEEDHIKAFITGLIDGDGYIGFNGKRWNISLGKRLV